MIVEAANSLPEDQVLRCLRATAAVEGAEHLPEMFDFAKRDLIWLESRIKPDDSVSAFFLNLNWAKFYYKLSKDDKEGDNIEKALERVLLAERYACTPVYLEWAKEWELRITGARH